MTSVDISTFTQVAAGVAEVVLPLLAAYLVKIIDAHLKISSTAAAAGHVQNGVDALADLAVDAMRSAAAQNQHIEVSDAVAKALNATSNQLIRATQIAGTTPLDLASRVTTVTVSKLHDLGVLLGTPSTPATGA